MPPAPIAGVYLLPYDLAMEYRQPPAGLGVLSRNNRDTRRTFRGKNAILGVGLGLGGGAVP